ncbi:GroES-like protein [Bimuria novae-zelandiae CBS 107.79]|uniref:GroES-like protein n=1 Tax=Bimuria novae-zelandiae CBS 107.79 TaxID=1447943 RepID=A0A6A5V176_9PLEO|nr:GroES-like protein [Bimuria novae-zelandiae CBS 107.79]
MTNQAAWIPEAKAQVVVKEAPMPTPGEGEVVIKNHAWAINPIDWKIQQFGIMLKSYPNILGVDSAGEVHAVGPGVTHVKKGDRVLVAKTLSLPYPTLSPSPPPANGGNVKSILIWGASASVGATAVQLAASTPSLKTIAVCGPKNFDAIRSLGAHAVFSRSSPSLTQDILAALQGTEYVGVVDCISTKESVAGWTPVWKERGGRYASVMPDVPGVPEGAQGAMVWAPTVAFRDREIGEKVWGEWVPKALERGLLKAVPPPRVVGKGLESLQDGIDAQRKGVSFEKIVVEA